MKSQSNLRVQAMDYKKKNTIHGKGILDIELDEETGEVVSVWYNCLALPFKAKKTRKDRANEMRRMYEHPIHSIIGIEISQDEEDDIVLRPKDKLPACKIHPDEDVIPGEEHCEQCAWVIHLNKLLDEHRIPMP